MKAHYIGSGDVLARGWSSPAGKHPFGDWLKGEDNVENLVRTDFQLFYISIEDQGEYESLETALQEWNKVSREDKLPFEISETSGSGGRQGSRLRNSLRNVRVMELEEIAAMQKGINARLQILWMDGEHENVLSRNQS